VHDASAKISSGILNGNVNQYGDFDQCLGAVAKSNNFQGQYCLAHIQPSVTVNSQPYLNYLRTLSLSFEAYKSKFEDVSEPIAVDALCVLINQQTCPLSRAMFCPKHRKSIGDFVFLLHARIAMLKSHWVKSFSTFPKAQESKLICR